MTAVLDPGRRASSVPVVRSALAAGQTSLRAPTMCVVFEADGVAVLDLRDNPPDCVPLKLHHGLSVVLDDGGFQKAAEPVPPILLRPVR